MTSESWWTASAEVEQALRERRPIVALESTVIAHGLPKPANLQLARELEEIVRKAGAVPATVAILDGQARVGLAEGELTRLGSEEHFDKLSTRDLPVAIARRRNGATTVASTAHIARAAGIAVFATGGIGGVHRGDPLDVSSDLTELQKTPIIVVCAGAKSILDLPATREYLETANILVLGWQTDEFPAFFSISSGLSVDARADSAAEVAAIWRAQQQTSTGTALLLCAPVPSESALPNDRIDAAIESALKAAREQGVQGKQVTPFLLRRIVEESNGASLRANIALLRNNAAVAAAVAVEVTSG